MEENKNVEQQSSGVVIPPEIVADSMKKKKARRTYNLRKLCISLMGETFWSYFYVKGRYESIHVINKYKPIKLL